MKKMNLALLGVMLIAMSSCKKMPFKAPEQELVVTTFAGGGGNGYADGPALHNSFNLPQCMVTDPSGNVFVADYGNNCIRKITPEGAVSTVAGTTEEGLVNGTGAAARFNGPIGITIDASGNLYVSERNNHTIRKITPAGAVTTLAGSGSGGFADGTGTAAKFNNPYGITIDKNGNLYVADRENSRIRKVTSAGVVTTYAGNGTWENTDGVGTAASIYGPFGIAIDGAGNIYCSSWGPGYVVRKITPTAEVSTYIGNTNDNYPFGGYVNGFRTSAKFGSFALGLAVDAKDNLYIADGFNSVIRKVTSDGVVSTFAGKYTNMQTVVLPGSSTGPATFKMWSNVIGLHKDGLADQTEFWYPNNIACDKNGNVYVAEGYIYDRKNSFSSIRKISLVNKEDSQEAKDRKNWNKPQSW